MSFTGRAVGPAYLKRKSARLRTNRAFDKSLASGGRRTWTAGGRSLRGPGGTMSQQTYWSADSAFEAERERLSILEHVFDDVTRDSLAHLGVREGWRCCEIGAGGGSVTRWLAQVVGPIGRV